MSLGGAKNGAILRHLQHLGPHYEVILAYGGTLDDFNQINFKNKVYIPDASLRGQSDHITYHDLIARVKASFTTAQFDPEWVFISDYDLVPLRENYLREPISLMKEHGAGFAGKAIRDVSLSNEIFLVNAIREGIMDRMPLVNGTGRNIVYHVLGAALLFHRSCFDIAMILPKNSTPPCSRSPSRPSPA